jgi:succinyl-CoA synthetase alpha subunit
MAATDLPAPKAPEREVAETAILVTGSTEVMVQGITGGAARTYTKLMLEYGTKVVGGISPGKGGEEVHGVPVYDTVHECQEHHPDVKATALWVPPKHARDAIMEAVDASIRVIVLTTQGVPVHDILYTRRRAWEKGLILLGGNTLGIISPGRSLLGMLPKVAFRQGNIGIVSRSGIITYYISNTLDLAGMGVSTNVVLGGDLFLGSGYEDILRRFEEDPDTHAVVIAGQPAGAHEETAVGFVKNMKKPVVAFIAGTRLPEAEWLSQPTPPVTSAPPTGAAKARAFMDAGIPVADSLMDIPRLLKKAMRR